MTSFSFFLLAVVAILVTPGPTNTLLCTSGALVAITRSLRLIVAEIAGYLVAIGVMILVGRPAIAGLPVLGLILRIVLTGYLLLLAWRFWHIDLALYDTQARAVTFGQVFLTTLLNPKAAVFAFAIFPTFNSLSASLPYFAAFTLLVMVVGACWIALGAVVGRIEDGRAARVVPRAAAAILCVAATVIAGSAIAAWS
jgi:threonine/homoserine/homoserine lactone efflux protein